MIQHDAWRSVDKAIRCGWLCTTVCLILYSIYEQCMKYTTKWGKLKVLPTLKVTEFFLGNIHMTTSLLLWHRTNFTWHLNLLINTGTPAEHNSCSASRLRHVWSSICFSNTQTLCNFHYHSQTLGQIQKLWKLVSSTRLKKRGHNWTFLSQFCGKKNCVFTSFSMK